MTRKNLIYLLLSMQGSGLNKELHEAGADVTASAFTQQRKKLPWEVMQDVLRKFNDICRDSDRKTYNRYKIFAVDGMTLRTARNPKDESFVPFGEDGKGYNALHVNAMYDVLNKTYVYAEIDPQPKQDEVGALYLMLVWESYPEKTLIVADRGYESYNMFAAFLETKKADILIRVKQDRSAMREIRKLPMEELDVDVSFTITTTQTKEDKRNGYIFIQTQKDETRKYSAKTRNGRWEFGSPYHMAFRIVRFQLTTGEYETLATSLPRTFTLEQIKELYHARWGIETAFRELKYGIGLINQHGKNDDFVKQEVYASLTLSNFCSRIASQIVIGKKKTNVYEYKVNMKMCIYLCRKFFSGKGTYEDAEKLIRDIAKYTEPVRPDRQDERKIKSKPFVGFTYRVSA